MSSRPRRGREGCLHIDVIERIDGRRFGIVLLGPNRTVVDRLLLLLEQILEDELGPSAAACLHQRTTLVELSSLTGANPSCLAKAATGAVASSSSLDRKTARCRPRQSDRQPGWPQPGD